MTVIYGGSDLIRFLVWLTINMQDIHLKGQQAESKLHIYLTTNVYLQTVAYFPN